MILDAPWNRPGSRGPGAFTLVEVVVSAAILMIASAALILGYVNTAQRAEWTACSRAAQDLARQRMEQTKSARWDPSANPAVDELTTVNFPLQAVTMDLPVSGAAVMRATNYTTITTISWSPQTRLIRVDCVWRFLDRGLFTNSVVTYRSPDA